MEIGKEWTFEHTIECSVSIDFALGILDQCREFGQSIRVSSPIFVQNHLVRERLCNYCATSGFAVDDLRVANVESQYSESEAYVLNSRATRRSGSLSSRGVLGDS
jgi:hypothetical protein